MGSSTVKNIFPSTLEEKFHENSGQISARRVAIHHASVVLFTKTANSTVQNARNHVAGKWDR
ncbi:hypothetical protein A3D11_04115 [Candidatus Peribacteria bacterium RIFCSPHIGHO2_02_FULL_49_16]|nr:MAG: hypothetical protein A2880_00205 [Candidatus Peribacteria bacterium RIFCSPHIGHO2_01_FULL_49_38]OGJ59183.1 MAG: hypothetical protein A3D11_04115 [Candidatus Peribacteria bacterium RIFCSPHIGHO2_02_FULL_49_16]